MYFRSTFYRLQRTFITLNDEDPVLLSQNMYNELGELKERKLHSENYSSFVQDVDYSYNIRGWLTKINDIETMSTEGDLFGMELLYDNEHSNLGNDARFNGNISALSWGNEGDNCKSRLVRTTAPILY